MQKPELFKLNPELESEIPWIQLIEKATDLHSLDGVGSRWGSLSLSIKREDQTGRVYGGNKVRNLEFVLGEARAKDASELVTLVPYGSNFTAALSAQGRLSGFQVKLCQFVAEKNSQIDAHAEFSQSEGALLSTYQGHLGPVLATARAVQYMLKSDQRAYWISPGASSVTGALGHANAALEAVAQWKAQGVQPPDFIIVGAGTCGTITGLSAGLQIAGVKTKVIGVRCAEPIVCNRLRIGRLGGRLAKKLGLGQKFDMDRVIIVESPGNIGYGVPTPGAQEVAREFEEIEGIELDSTYTAKVAAFIKDRLKDGDFRQRRLLYWHTYSPAAVEWKRAPFTKNLDLGAQKCFDFQRRNDVAPIF
jgi:1-aminocyclopropane-1-carboxylate deaminase/D-cysteine desulfhydrase-like pyridoxal-dependent ACC family enzyme